MHRGRWGIFEPESDAILEAGDSLMVGLEVIGFKAVIDSELSGSDTELSVGDLDQLDSGIGVVEKASVGVAVMADGERQRQDRVREFAVKSEASFVHDRVSWASKKRKLSVRSNAGWRKPDALGESVVIKTVFTVSAVTCVSVPVKPLPV